MILRNATLIALSYFHLSTPLTLILSHTIEDLRRFSEIRNTIRVYTSYNGTVTFKQVVIKVIKSFLLSREYGVALVSQLECLGINSFTNCDDVKVTNQL
jgi:hypothetical protein